MKRDSMVLASINLHAVLRNIEDLCRLAPEARKLISGSRTAIRFSVPGIRPLTLDFRNGECKASDDPGAEYNMKLRFTNPEHFNGMVDGKRNPIPTRGFRHLGFLKDKFTKLAEILTSYLRPDPARLQRDPEFRRRSTILTAYTAFYALSEIARLDPLGRITAARIPDGDILVEAEELAINLEVAGGRLQTKKGRLEYPDALMYFDSIDTANGILGGTLDSYACIGSGRLTLSGRIPMLDNLNKLLSQVAGYLS